MTGLDYESNFNQLTNCGFLPGLAYLLLQDRVAIPDLIDPFSVRDQLSKQDSVYSIA